ncbi:hypothetical protein EJ110_NYTH34465 [Nymphaea thermarum]|nr:hypothetical protein EJ110_NYTH34465 [Nymphaea thermarum]
MATTSPIQWNAAAALVSIKLNRDNYLLWRSQVESVMDSQDLLQFVDETQVEPPKEITKDGKTEMNPKFVTWRKLDRLALSWIKATIIEAVLGQIMRAKTAFDAWTTLEKSYGSQSPLRIMLLRKELLLIKKGKGFSAVEEEEIEVAVEINFRDVEISLSHNRNLLILLIYLKKINHMVRSRAILQRNHAPLADAPGTHLECGSNRVVANALCRPHFDEKGRIIRIQNGYIDIPRPDHELGSAGSKDRAICEVM